MYKIFLALITGFIITFFAIPSIIKLARKRRYVDEPDERKSHVVSTPSLGGIGIFAGTLFSVILWTPFSYFGRLQYILAALVVMFLIGARDDIEPIAAWKKLAGQLFVALIVIFFAEVRLTSIYGIFGITELPFSLSVILTLLIIVLIINAFNLIDGINGLSGSLAAIMAITFGAWFYLVGRVEMTAIAFALAGSLVAFLYYNITPAKIFMGDTGSLFIGLLAAIMAIIFIEQHQILGDSPYAFKAPPAVAAGIIIIPVFDTLRLFLIRLIKGRSPFDPDKKHIHHLLLNTGLSHMQATLTLVVINILFIIVAIYFQQLGTFKLLVLLLFLASLLTAFLTLILNMKTPNKFNTS